MIRRVAVLGATGSIGTRVLQVIRDHPDRYRAHVLTAHQNVDALVRQCALHRPDLAIIADTAMEAALTRRLAAIGIRCDVASGADALTQATASATCDTAVVTIPGLAGISAALAAVRTGKQLLLGDHESAAIAGPLWQQALSTGGGTLIPLAEELYTAFLCMASAPAHSTRKRLILAGSGGPFLGRSRSQLMAVERVPLRDPSQTARSAVDRASLMHNGLQLLAAQALFAQAPACIDTLIQPDGQTQVLLEHADGSLWTQRAVVDPYQIMAQALAWPARECLQAPGEPADPLPLDQPDLSTFRCLALACAALRAGGDAPAILNAANAVAVEAFLAGSLPFLSIADLIEQVLTELPSRPVVDIQTLSERDRAAREAARRVLRNAC